MTRVAILCIKEDAKKMQTSKDPRDISLSDVTCNCLSFILKVLRPVDENSAEPQSIDRSCSAGASCLSCGKILKKYSHSPQAVARAIVEQGSLSKRARYNEMLGRRRL